MVRDATGEPLIGERYKKGKNLNIMWIYKHIIPHPTLTFLAYAENKSIDICKRRFTSEEDLIATTRQWSSNIVEI